MDWGLIRAMAMGLARAGAVAFSTWLVNQGAATQDQGSQIVGGSLALVTVGFTLYDKVMVKSKITTAAVTGVAK